MSNGAMNVKETRKNNLLILLRKFKSQREFADVVGTSEYYISQITTGAKGSTGKPRGMGDPLARKIEKKMDLDDGWMDVPHQDPNGMKLIETQHPIDYSLDRAQVRQTFDIIFSTFKDEFIDASVEQKTTMFLITYELASLKLNAPQVLRIVKSAIN